MAVFRLAPEESSPDPTQQHPPPQQQLQTDRDVASDDERSVAADSWSIKSDYGSTLDDEQRHVDAAEALSSAANSRASPYYSSDKDEPDADAMTTVLSLQSYRNGANSDELANSHEHGHAAEIWIGADIIDTFTSWTKSLCIDISQGHMPNHVDEAKCEPVSQDEKYLSCWSVLDIGTGNGLLLQELAKQGFTDLTGIDYSEGTIDVARSHADRDGFSSIKFLVDDIIETKLEKQFQLVMDKGTLDAIGLHPDGPIKRMMYWDSVSKLVAPGGVLVITSCNHTKDELVHEVESFNQRNTGMPQETHTDRPRFRYLNHVRTYPTFMFGGSLGTHVATVAFQRN
ncbi:putative S-adenosyl-L-methionine-dependent methyltransferases superfamily protein [Hibiscus syriacus]|uniref:Protein-lysine N-methyltransferase F3Y22_tig00111398pilonHSYRG00447 n=1 Tax=Hibiscus syriacus TaxID=106335 RepID=A0A6A2XVZ3_HIBSY|nr:EEF1A lysine methyltransferase 2-like [Hibiscus syriacus]KAE8679748.1 putative S-adenosyl-L-methionine-dependent methyltransferases superfamily protein [Hibiscus syriacus]